LLRRNQMLEEMSFVHVGVVRNIKIVVEDSNTNGLQEMTEGQNRKFKELDTF